MIEHNIDPGATLEEFRSLSEREVFAHWYGTQIGIQKLRKAANEKPDSSDSNHTHREILRSKFGVVNIKKNVEEARQYYDDHA